MRKIILLACLLLILSGCKLNGPEGVVVRINDQTWVAEVADTPQTQAQGLMGRESMPKNRGMLFLFPEEQPLKFWMKNTKIPLDMIFIDSNWRVVSITQNAKPCTEDPCPTYNSTRDAKYVLEVNAGQAREKNVKIGSKVDTSLK